MGGRAMMWAGCTLSRFNEQSSIQAATKLHSTSPWHTSPRDSLSACSRQHTVSHTWAGEDVG